MVTTLLLGFALGLRHATDADHIVAVSGLLDDGATRSTRQAARVGALWGLGHMGAVLLAGGLVLALRVAIPAWLEWTLELVVAFVLIALGARIIANCFRGKYHFHVHRHGELPHAHLHFHAQETPQSDHSAHVHGGWKRNRGPLLIGAAHGLAGSAALTLLVLASIPSRLFGAFYLAAFGLGALVGMAAFSAVLSWPMGRLGERSSWMQGIRLTAGVANAGLGAFLVYRAMLPHAWPF